MKKGTTVTPLPTAEEFNRLVDELVAPDEGEKALPFIQILQAMANPEDDESWALTQSMIRHAFTKTQAFEDAFRAFAGHLPAPQILPETDKLYSGMEM